MLILIGAVSSYLVLGKTEVISGEIQRTHWSAISLRSVLAFGRRIVEAGIRNGACVLVARQQEPLQRLAHEVPGAEVLALDATEEDSPSKVFDVLQPDILVIGGRTFETVTKLYARTRLMAVQLPSCRSIQK